jgi:hypothetical protein
MAWPNWTGLMMKSCSVIFTNPNMGNDGIVVWGCSQPKIVNLPTTNGLGYIYIFTYVCMYVYIWDSDGEREREIYIYTHGQQLADAGSLKYKSMGDPQSYTIPKGSGLFMVYCNRTWECWGVMSGQFQRSSSRFCGFKILRDETTIYDWL